MTVKDAAKIVLKASNEPLNVQQIAQRILNQGLWKTEEKTPESTMYAQILTEIKRYKDSGRSPRFYPARKWIGWLVEMGGQGSGLGD
ncbi:MAG: winged helix-turn-helix domain-containing protein [Sphaerochaeta sp.]